MKTLIVEEDLPSQKFMQKVLQQFGRSDIAADGQVAIDMFQKTFNENGGYDLVCLDIMLPKMDGQEVLTRICKLEEDHGISGLEGVKIIMTTALRDSKNIMRAFTAQCEAYLAKPIEKDALIAELRSFGLID